MIVNWHILTGEYPPMPGGVGDYAFIVAGALAAEGDPVDVWCPAGAGTPVEQAGVLVHSDLDGYYPSHLWRLGRRLDSMPRPRRLLVEWVPQAFGMKAVNLPFCLWLLGRRVASGDVIDLMIHEAFLDIRGSLRQRLAGIVQRLMVSVLLLASTRVWVSVPRWGQLVRPFTLDRRARARWLPVPSNIPLVPHSERVHSLRDETNGTPTVGHFGSFNPATNARLIPILEAVLEVCPEVALRLIGRGATTAKDELIVRRPGISERILVSDGVQRDEAANQIAACDVMIQPYPDGISSRRTSFMAGFALGVATVTHAAECTEPIWSELEACILVDPAPDAYAMATAALLADREARIRIGERARQVYDEKFHIRHVVGRLRHPLDTLHRSDDPTLGGASSGEGRL